MLIDSVLFSIKIYIGYGYSESESFLITGGKKE